MGRTKPFARSALAIPPNNGGGAGEVTNNSTPQDDVPQTEYYPIVLNWTTQGIEQQRKLNYRADLEEANDIIIARLAGHFVKADDLAWAKRVGEQERERAAAEKEARKKELRRRWAPRPMRKIKAGKRLTAAELRSLDPNAEDSSSILTEVSNVSDLNPGLQGSPAVPEVCQVVLLDKVAPADSSSHTQQSEEEGVEGSASHSQPQDGEEEESDDGDNEDSFDEEYWANEAALWDAGSANSAVAQEDDREEDDGAEHDEDDVLLLG